MTVYVDDMYRRPLGRLGRMKMSHMMADTTDELLEMADRIGLSRVHIQNAGTPSEHFDVSMSKRKLAIDAGAQEVSMKDMARKVTLRKVQQRDEDTKQP